MQNQVFLDQTVLVTGGASGIGAAIVKQFADEGAAVFIIDILEEEGHKFSDLLNEHGGTTYFIKCDISEPSQIDLMSKEVKEKAGKLDILINNAGISKSQPIFSLEVEDWDKVINTNLRGAFLCAKMAVEMMKERGGKIINIGSTRAYMSEPGWEAYGASKGGTVALTHALAISLSEFKIQVNCISPGWIMTQDENLLRKEDHDQHPSGRVGKPEDIARACTFLCDPKNDFINGENVIIDGGMTRKMIYLE